jgi:hypothetical protein
MPVVLQSRTAHARQVKAEHSVPVRCLLMLVRNLATSDNFTHFNNKEHIGKVYEKF